MKRNYLWLVGLSAAFFCPAPLLWSRTLNVVGDYGADNTGGTYATASIQKAIDACNPDDTLLIPAGTYLMDNGLTLKSEMTVELSSNAVLQANMAGVWLKNKSPIVGGHRLDHVTITGGGIIDGGGLNYTRSKGTQPGRGIRFLECTNLTVRNITVRNIPNFAVDFANSQNVTAESLVIRGRGFDNLRGSADGLDIEGCVNVAVSRCNIEVGDDGLCLKTIDGEHPCHNIRINDCTLASTCNAFKIGTGTVADVYDVTAENIIVNKHSHPGRGNPVPSGDCIAAIAIESNDHHRTHDIICRNFTINSYYCPIYFELQNRQSYEKGAMGRLDRVLIENIDCRRSIQPIIFNWQCDGANRMTDVTLSHLTVHNYGTQAGAELTCMSGGYPDANKNGLADAHGIWARGVMNLQLKCLNLYDDGRSKRQKFVFDPSVQNVDSSAVDDCMVKPQ